MRRTFVLAVILAVSGLSAPAFAQPFDPSLYGDMRWRLVGPFRGGWATCARV